MSPILKTTEEYSNGSSISNKNSSKEQFISHSSPNEITQIVKILESRLPLSSHAYNMAKMYNRFAPNIKIYTLHGDLSPERSIIMMTAPRQDFEQDIVISIPQDFSPTPEIKDAFCDTKAIEWDNSAYLFSSIDLKIAPMIFEISSIVKKNSTTCNPNYLFIMDAEEAIGLDIKLTDPNLEILPIDSKVGAQFILKNWKYAQDGSEDFVNDMLSKLPSSGLYDKTTGKILSGMLSYSHGLIGMLSTDPHERNKGYASIVMRNMLKEQALEGFIPSSGAEMHNTASVNFHKKMGMKIVQECAYVFHCRPSYS